MPFLRKPPATVRSRGGRSWLHLFWAVCHCEENLPAGRQATPNVAIPLFLQPLSLPRRSGLLLAKADFLLTRRNSRLN